MTLTSSVGWVGVQNVPRRVDAWKATWDQLEVRGHSGGWGLSVLGAHPVAAPVRRECSFMCSGSWLEQVGAFRGGKDGFWPQGLLPGLKSEWGLFPARHTQPSCVLCSPHAAPGLPLPPPRENQYPTGNNLCHTEGESSVMPTHPFRAAERTVSAASGAIAPGNDTCPT